MTVNSAYFAIIMSVARALFLGSIGAAIFYWLGLPAPWLSGAMIAVAIGMFSNIRCSIPDPMRNGLFVILGLSMGSGVQPEAIARIGEWPVSMLLLLLAVVAILVCSTWFLRHIAKWSAVTSYFASIPGALSYVIAIAESYPKADMPRIAISQSIRLFILVAILPPVIVSLNGEAQDGEILVELAPVVPLAALALMIPVGAFIGWVAVRLRVPGGWLTAPFFLSAILNGSGAYNFVLPEELTIPCMVAFGAMIGTRFGKINPAILGRLFLACLGAFCVSMGISMAISLLVSWLLHVPFGQVLLAFAPGGLEVMTLLAFVLHLDPTFVAAHQLARYIAMVLLLPLATRLLIGRPDE